MAQVFTDKTIIINKNEDADDKARLCVRTNSEKGTVTIAKQNWGGDSDLVEIPEQFLEDIHLAILEVMGFNANKRKAKE